MIDTTLETAAPWPKLRLGCPHVEPVDGERELPVPLVHRRLPGCSARNDPDRRNALYEPGSAPGVFRESLSTRTG
jgi:hypothetical protein